MAKQTKDNWHESYRERPFSLAVSNHIRYLTWKREQLINERKDAFDTRDDLLVKLGEATKQEAAELKIEHSDVVRTIENLATSIKWHDNKLAWVIKNADDATLFEDESVPLPPKELFQHKAKPAKAEDEPKRDPAKDDDKETGKLPVGVPDEDAPPPAAKAPKPPLEEKAVDAGGRRKRGAK